MEAGGSRTGMNPMSIHNYEPRCRQGFQRLGLISLGCAGDGANASWCRGLAARPMAKGVGGMSRIARSKGVRTRRLRSEGRKRAISLWHRSRVAAELRGDGRLIKSTW